jgi:hypothetical protein
LLKYISKDGGMVTKNILPRVVAYKEDVLLSVDEYKLPA